MPTIQKRNKSYLISVSCGYDCRGVQIRKTMTWKPDPGMTQTQIQKELNRQAVIFEEKCLSGSLDDNIKFSEFAAIFMNDRKKRSSQKNLRQI